MNDTLEMDRDGDLWRVTEDAAGNAEARLLGHVTDPDAYAFEVRHLWPLIDGFRAEWDDACDPAAEAGHVFDTTRGF